MDSYGGNDPVGMFPLSSKQVARELAPKLTVIFRLLIKGDSCSTCWRLADVISVPKGSASSDVGDYRPVSIMPVPAKELEKIVAEKLSILFWRVTECFLLLSFHFAGAWEH